MTVRNRIRELRTVRAGDLRPNPRNWRTHPEFQQRALEAVLAEVGFADALIARELADGSLELIDGHLRAEILPDDRLPVLVLDVDEQEADKLLASLDPLASLAGCNQRAIESLLDHVRSDSEHLQSVFDNLAAEQPAAGRRTDGGSPQPEISPPIEIGESFQVVAECRDEAEQRQLYERLVAEGFRCRVLTL